MKRSDEGIAQAAGIVRFQRSDQADAHAASRGRLTQIKDVQAGAVMLQLCQGRSPMYLAASALWAIFLIAAVFYTRWARYPSARPLAAYLIFVTVFTVSAFFLFACLTVLLEALGQIAALTDPIVAVVFLLAVFLPAFLVARWQLRKPPRQPKAP